MSNFTGKKDAIDYIQRTIEYVTKCNTKKRDYAKRLEAHKLKQELYEHYVATGDKAPYQEAFPKLKTVKAPKTPKELTLPEHPGREVITEDFTHDENLELERQYLGFYISDNPLNSITELIFKETNTNIEEVKEGHFEGDVAIFIGIITNVEERTTKRKNKMATITLQDLSGEAEMLVFPKAFAMNKERIKEGKIVKIKAAIEYDRFFNEEEERTIVTTKMNALSVRAIDTSQESIVERINLVLTPKIDYTALNEIETILSEHKTSSSEGTSVCLQMPPKVEAFADFKVNFNRRLVEDIQNLGVIIDRI